MFIGARRLVRKNACEASNLIKLTNVDEVLIDGSGGSISDGMWLKMLLVKNDTGDPE